MTNKLTCDCDVGFWQGRCLGCDAPVLTQRSGLGWKLVTLIALNLIALGAFIVWLAHQGATP